MNTIMFTSHLISKSRTVQVSMFIIIVLLCVLHKAWGADFRGQSLTEVPPPEDIPASDTDLLLLDNSIEYIPAGALCHMTALTKINIQRNQLSALGNLSCVGQTLEKLYADINPIRVIPASALEGLVKLDYLSISSAQLVTFPELQHVSSTLEKLRVDSNPNLEGNIPEDELASLSVLTYLNMNNVGLTEFPSLPEMPALTELLIGSGNMDFGDQDILSGLPEITKLSITNAQMTKFPLIDHEPLLPTLDLSNNKFIPTGPENFLIFPQVTTLNLKSCSMTSFPNFRYIAKNLRKLYMESNPLKIIPKDLLYEVPYLTHLYVKNTQLTELPCLHVAFLSVIEAAGNSFTELPCIAANTNRIVLDSPITSIDIHHAASLSQLKDLLMRSQTSVEKVHDYVNLEKHPRAHLNIAGCTNLDLCKCEHVWMKIAIEMGANFHVSDRECGGNGEMWVDMNSTVLLEQCDQSSLTGEYRKNPA